MRASSRARSYSCSSLATATTTNAIVTKGEEQEREEEAYIMATHAINDASENKVWPQS
jgi:hypothetical protein